MFEQCLLGSGTAPRARSTCAALFSVVLQSALIGAAALVPLIFTSPLPGRSRWAFLLAPPPPAPGASAARLRPAAGRSTPAARFDDTRLLTRLAKPGKLALIPDEAPPGSFAGEARELSGAPGSVPGVRTGMAGLFSATTPALAPPAAVSPPPSPAPRSVRVGGDVQKARQVYAPLPVYPPLARQLRISGVVRLNAIIGEDGTVEQWRVISGHPMLVDAAVEAVSSWRYRPALLNGEPVQVITQIDVFFILK